MQEDQSPTPLVISIKEGQIVSDFNKLIKILATSCLRPSSVQCGTIANDNENEKPNAGAIDHTPVGSHNFAVVTVVGPPGSGKSFFTNWIAKYFAANGLRTWLEGDNKAPLGGFGWNPHPEDGDVEEDVDEETGIRILRDLPSLYEIEDDESGQKNDKRVKVILLDIDLHSKQDVEFKKQYTALTASCMLISTLTIYLDTEPKSNFDPRLLLSLLGSVLSSNSSITSPNIVTMINKHFTPHPGSFASDLKSFFDGRGGIPVPTFELPALKHFKGGQFQGALEHMVKQQLILAMTRMASVDGLLRNPQTTPNIFALIQKVVIRVNEAMNPSIWAQLRPFIPIPPPAAPVPAATNPPSKAISQLKPGQNVVTQLRQNRNVTTSNANVLNNVDEPESKLAVVGGSNTFKQIQKSRTANGVEADQVQDRASKDPTTSLLLATQEIDQQQRLAAALLARESILKPTEPKPQHSGSVQIPTHYAKSGEQAPTPTISEPEKTAICATKSNPRKLKAPETKEEVDAHIQRCRPEFMDLLQKNIPLFIISSMVRVPAVDMLTQLIVVRNFQGVSAELQKYAAGAFGELTNKWFEELVYITEAIDKGRNIIDNEFDSELFLPGDAEIKKLVQRAKKFSADRFRSKNEKHATFFDTCWEATEHNTKLRNNMVREYERQINEAAIDVVFEFYSVKLLELIDVGENLSDADLVRIPRSNEELVTDCLKMLAELKDCRHENERVRGNLSARMTAFYLNKIGGRIAEVQKQRQLEEKRKREELEKQTREGLEKNRKEAEKRKKQEEQTSKKRAEVTPTTKMNTSFNSPLHREKLYPDLRDEAGASLSPSYASVVSGNSTPLQNCGAILVLHLGRDSSVKVAPVGFAQDYAPKNFPAYVAFVDGEFVIGEPAMGVPGQLCLQEIHAGTQTFTLRGEEMRYEQILGLFLGKCKQMFEDYFRTTFATSLLIIPALSSIVQRQAICDSATLAGFTEAKLISEPTAVAFDYFHRHLKGMTTRSKETAMVLYFGSNGEKELALYRASPRQDTDDVIIEMASLTGTIFLPNLSSPPAGWSLSALAFWRSSSEYKKYAHDIFTRANVPNYISNHMQLIMAGDSDDVVTRTMREVDIAKNRIQFTRHDRGECAVYGGMLLATRVVQGGQYKVLVAEKLGIPVTMKAQTGHIRPLWPVLGRNSDLPSNSYKDVFDVTGTFKFDLITEDTGKSPLLGKYMVHFEPPNPDDCTYMMKCLFDISMNGIVGVEGKLHEQSIYGTRFFSIPIQRTDDLNLNSEDSRNKCKRFIQEALQLRGAQEREEQEKETAKAELGDYLSHLKQLQKQFNEFKGDIRESVEAEINAAETLLQNPNTDLETLRLQSLNLRKLISKFE